ncbi:stage IV sporulation protein SpoIVB [[Clostridium] sordellii]|uniref:SpoIVB peptidase S55 domain-containing protein n=1 Tax=Paraclostridium sordellii TaxID=1505 RepID=UPI0005DABB27|nr:SpoIVB peptidase S55 domain-containing protein [Paeniclostridium sordellii]MBX9180032.1 hypothetical protein [Paeniclostridium sordellii]CEO11129.1 stage IV sporulation protein SpoIVB [[Clostridium] sordellii] [Paeniclostridium sordellii]CEP84085.1 stage IV sporulation protein SpoIVB [[Clostridium] sordellii] [Paeniclostridium sordellii]
MKSSKVIKFFIFFVINILIIVFPDYCYSIQKYKNIPNEVIIGGELINLELKTNNVMLFDMNNKSKLKNYDLILSASGNVVNRVFNKNNIGIKSKKDLTSILISMKKNEKVNLDILRDQNLNKVEVTKNEIKFDNLIDKIPYTATLTYLNPVNNEFKAVAHNIEFDYNKEALSKKGCIYNANVKTITKSSKKSVGNIVGKSMDNLQGNIESINKFGVSGRLNKNMLNKKKYRVANESEVNIGKAYIVMKHNKDEEAKLYKINITKINKNFDGNLINFEFEIKDKNLKNTYGGIVQGMSGSPIIQNNKIIGALSHVITTDTSKGVGVYIKIMMK